MIKALMTILWARDRASLEDCYHYIRERRANFTDIVSAGVLADQLDMIPFNGSSIDGSLDELAKDIVDQLSQPKRDGDLIDTIVSAIGLPHAGSVLSGRTIDTLRRAILLPDEIVGLRTRLAEQELHCSSCGRPFGSNEMVTFVKNMTSHASPFLYCASCRLPSTRACVSCHDTNKVMLSASVLRSMQKACTCDACKRDAEIGADNATSGPQPAAPTPATYTGRRYSAASLDQVTQGAAPTPVRGNRRTVQVAVDWAPSPPPADNPQFTGFIQDEVAPALSPIQIDTLLNTTGRGR